MRGKILLLIVLAIIILGVGSAASYRIFFIAFVKVPTGSMANTIIPGDQLVIKKRAFGEVERGNLVVLKWPKDPAIHYVSRVVGLPGETIEVRDRIVLIDGQELQEQRVTVKDDDLSEHEMLPELSSEGAGPYRVFYYARDGSEAPRVPPARETTFGIDTPFKIPDGQYFVMGDNRDNSYDSRFWGPVSRDGIIGKPTMIYWSSRPDKSGSEQDRWERIFTKVR